MRTEFHEDVSNHAISKPWYLIQVTHSNDTTKPCMNVLVIQNSRVRNKSGLQKNLQNYYITTNFTFQNERCKEIKTIWNRV